MDRNGFSYTDLIKFYMYAEKKDSLFIKGSFVSYLCHRYYTKILLIYRQD